jgi:hypothetical protein
LRLLLVADTPAEIEALRALLACQEAVCRPALDYVNTIEPACTRLTTDGVDIVMLTIDEGSAAALARRLQAVARVRAAGPNISVVALIDF